MNQRRQLEKEFQNVVLNWNGGYRITFRISVTKGEYAKYDIREWEENINKYNEKVRQFHGEDKCAIFLIQKDKIDIGDNRIVVQLPSNVISEEIAGAEYGSRVREALDSGRVRYFVAFEKVGFIKLRPDGFSGMGKNVMLGQFEIPYRDNSGTYELESFECI